ncbi:competence type IV pilus minor pilin ComGD [Halobacillus massiliensis]|uniref:competence type IV pilus minor pilin ComGD n=1 Tax=Halobacillus massiliensis TaxID=1926286 RepID=UPI0015C45611|nr:competence type IV pilus minor pilin ComGD [Halobacillus massiliensis]
MNNKGYTLSEVILVLTIFSIFLLLTAPLPAKLHSKTEADLYLEQLKSDLLLAQQLTMQDHPRYWIMIRPSSNEYYLYDGQARKSVFIRTFPPDWTIQLQSLSVPIRFNTAGTLERPGTMFISTSSNRYKITFPFGKSRVRIDEQ